MLFMRTFSNSPYKMENLVAKVFNNKQPMIIE